MAGRGRTCPGHRELSTRPSYLSAEVREMQPDASPRSTALDNLKLAFHTDDAAEVRRLLNEHPEFKASIDEPVGPFETPAIANVKSREMLDVLLDAGANIDARSKWWAGG